MKERVVNFRPIFYTFVAFMLGIIVARRFYSGSIEVIIVTLLLLAGFIGCCIYSKKYKPLILILAFFFLGNGFYYIGESSYHVKNYSGQVAVVGRVSDDIQKYSFSTHVVLDDVTINGEKTKNLRLEISDFYQNDLKVGNYLAFESEVERAQPYYIKKFNSKDYRAGVRYYSSVDYDDIVFKDNVKIGIDEVIRQDIKELIYKNMSEDNASIAYAVMFGDKSGLDGEIYTSYQQSGIIHVLTVSGLHVGFLVSLFYKLMRKCRVNNIANLIITSIVIILYAFLCGFSPSVVRAGVMAICMMFARAIHRKYDSLNALGLAGFVICIFKPLTALDIGFLMSFFCVFGIIMLNPILTKFFKIFFPDLIASLISLSISAQIGILPFLATMGGTLNLISFAVNIIIVPLFSFIYPYLFLVCMLGTFMPFLGVLLNVVDFLLVIINNIATFFGLAGLTIKLNELGFAVTIVFFLVLFLMGRYFMVKPIRKFAGLSLSLFVMVFVFCCYALPINISKKARITYLNSYGEMSVVLTSSSGQVAVIGENNLLKRYQTEYYRRDFHAYFSYERLSDEEVTDLTELGLYKFYTCAPKVDEGRGGVESVAVNSGYQLGDFNFSYLSYDDEVLGIIFIFDNQTIFVANKSNLDYNSYVNVISNYQPNVVIAGENNQLTKSDTYLCLTYEDVEGSEYSYQKDGNMELCFDGKNWIKRGLD